MTKGPSQSALTARLAAIHLVTASPIGETVDFYTSWGLEALHLTADEANTMARFRSTGTDHHVLQFRNAGHNGLELIEFTMGSRTAVDAYFNRISGLDPEAIETQPGTLSDASGGYGFTLRDLEGRRLQFGAERLAADPRPAVRGMPERLSHIVVNTVDIARMCAYYVQVLGFRVSDWSEGQMVFLRCGTDHHSIAFNQDQHVSVNHIAYEVATLDSFLSAVGRLKHHGIDPMWGIGRHGPGNNAFAYFADPVGFVPEITAEVQQIDEKTWIPRTWQRVPAQSDLWGLAGRPSDHMRARMAGNPDPNTVLREWVQQQNLQEGTQ
jgi:catechol-2,3-dioxygenase